MTERAHAAPYPSAAAVLERAIFEVKHVVVGQDAMVERMVIGLLARGHVSSRASPASRRPSPSAPSPPSSAATSSGSSSRPT